MLKNFSFHDCVVKSVDWDEKNLVITFDNKGGFTSLQKITYIDAEIVEQEGDLLEAWWLYEEIYRTESGYAFHTFLQTHNGEYIYFTVNAKDIVFK